MKFRKKPVVIEAIIWNNNFDEIYKFMDADNNYGIVGIKNGNSDILQIRTLEGVMDANIGDYIIRGVKGEYYPCKPDIFEMTYELASTSSQTEISDESWEGCDGCTEQDEIMYKNGYVKGYNAAIAELPKEISDEDIEEYAKKNAFQYYEFISGAKWYREQLKK